MTTTRALTRALALAALSLPGCQGCDPEDAGPDDAGPLFPGIDAPGYEPDDSGPLPPEPCAGTVRRLRWPLDESSLDAHLAVWGDGHHVLTSMGWPESRFRLFDIESEREVVVDPAASADDLVAAFPTSDGFELLFEPSGGIEGAYHRRLLRRDGTLEPLGIEPLRVPLTNGQHIVRLDEDHFAGLTVVGTSGDVPGRAVVWHAAPGEDVRIFELDLALVSWFGASVDVSGSTLVGVVEEPAARRIVRLEVELDTGVSRVEPLFDGARVDSPRGLLIAGLLIAAREGAVVAAVSHVSADAPDEAIGQAELVWWNVGGEVVARRGLAEAELPATFLAIGGREPRQTLAFVRHARARNMVMAARINGPGEVTGGETALALVTGGARGAAWESSPGAVTLALLSARELEVLVACEGVP